MASKVPPVVSLSNDMSKEDGISSTGGDVELQSGSAMDTSQGQLKRDLGSRHINMIAIAGMIVSFVHKTITVQMG
jgi:amino acid permease